MPKISTFLPAMWPAFFIRVRPASRKAKPACMNMTNTAVITTQIVLAAISRSWFLTTGLHLLQALARSVVHDVVNAGLPDEPVSRLVAAPRRIDDCRDDAFRDRVPDDEGQLRLREKARLEDPAAVLVRDAALAPVTDRLDDSHAYVPGLLLDRVDHGLDPLPDHNRFNLGHPLTSFVGPRKKPQDA